MWTHVILQNNRIVQCEEIDVPGKAEVRRWTPFIILSHDGQLLQEEMLVAAECLGFTLENVL